MSKAGRRWLIFLVVLLVLLVVTAFEWRYSSDMQAHIELVNSDLESVRLQSSLSTGLFGSIQVMGAEADVAREIIETHEHVHTLKDEVLAWKIKRAVGDSITVGSAMYAVIHAWPDSV